MLLKIRSLHENNSKCRICIVGLLKFSKINITIESIQRVFTDLDQLMEIFQLVVH